MATKLSNVIGAPFADYVLRQLVVRAYRSSTGQPNFGPRTNDEVLYLANKTAWARLVSSVDIVFPDGTNTQAQDLAAYIQKLGIEGSGQYITSNSLAKNWILEAGTSQVPINPLGVIPTQTGGGVLLRRGLGPNGAYGLGGTEELGYRPMPGLTSVTIDTAGRLGSLRSATISFKVWNMNQLNVIEALYFRLGYSMLLEWGHTQYYKNYEGDLTTTSNAGAFQSTGIHGIGDPFLNNKRKEDIQQEIEIKKFQTSGNYDGMLGIVTNFTWSFNEDGGYDCTLKLVGLGAVIDSMRINQAYKLPPGVLKKYKSSEKAIEDYYNRRLALLQKNLDQLKASGAGGGTGTAVGVGDVPKNQTELLQKLSDYDNGGVTLGDLNNYAIVSINSTLDPKDDRADYYGVFRNAKNNTSQVAAEKKFTGLYLSTSVRGGASQGLTYIPDPIQTGPPTVLLSDTVLKRFAGNDFRFYRYDGIQSGEAWYPGILDDRKKVPVTKMSELGIVSTSPLGGLVSYASAREEVITSGFRGAPQTRPIFVQPTDIVKRFSASGQLLGLSLLAEADVEYLTSSGGIDKKGIFLDLGLEVPYNIKSDFNINRKELVEAIDTWSKNPKLTIQSFNFTKGKPNIEIKGTIDIEVKAVYKGPPDTPANLKANDPSIQIEGSLAYKVIPVKLTLKTNNPGFIQGLYTPPTTSSSAGAGGGGGVSTGSSPSTPPKTDTQQKDAPDGFESALHAMLTVVQSEAQGQALTVSNSTKIVDLTDTTRQFYTGGALDGVFDSGSLSSAQLPIQNGIPTFDLKLCAAKGFSSELMKDLKLYPEIPFVGGTATTSNFKNLCQALVVQYLQDTPDNVPQPGSYAVYIPLGYLLAFINNLCLFYDSTQKEVTTTTTPPAGSEKRPYVYIDFNPETNFCLTSPQQFSIDPDVCLVPANLDQNEYLSIFPKDIKPETPFNPSKTNKVSDVLNRAGLNFQYIPGSAYRGKMMHIMLKTEYLLAILKNFTTTNPQHAVALQPFLERIMTDVNKCLGNVNLFRIAYRDDTNTVQIQDDQFVPRLASEDPGVIEKTTFLTNLKNKVLQTGEIPLFGSEIYDGNGNPISTPNLGIARQMQLRTVMNTKLASMIAISAQAATGSVNATDHSELSWLNQNFRDRYKPYIQDPGSGNNGSNVNPPTNKSTNKGKKNPAPISNDQDAANKFNNHVLSIYGSLSVDKSAINPAKNYYIERMSKVKSNDIVTSAAPFIPAEIEVTLDGISGIVMGNGFNIPQSRLPRSLRYDNGFTKVGFIVNGLTHTIDDNQWTTKIRGQMIKLREEDGVNTKTTVPTGQQIDFAGTGITGGGTARGTGLFTGNNAPVASDYLFGTAKNLGNSINQPAHANWGNLSSKWTNSNAWDLFVPPGTPVYAVADGTVTGITFAENFNTVWGYYFFLTTANNTFFYTHLDSVVAKGSVTKGQLLGYIGQWPPEYPRLANGGSHLHIGLKTGIIKNYIDGTGKFI